MFFPHARYVRECFSHDHASESAQIAQGMVVGRRQVLTALGVGSVGAVGMSALGVATSPNVHADPLPTAHGLDLSQVDTSVRPQDDIYQYVNGRWLNSFQLPADKACVDTFEELHEKNITQLRHILEGISPGGSAEEVKLQRFYHSALDTRALDAKGMANVQRQWDMISSAHTKERLAYVVGVLGHEYDFNFPINWDISPDSKNSSVYVFNLQGFDLNGGTSAGLGLKPRFLTDGHYSNIRWQYQQFLGKIIDLAHIPTSSQGWLASQVIELETQIARGVWAEEEIRDPIKTYNVSSLNQLARRYPGFDWHSFVAGWQIPTSYMERVIVDMPSYYQHFTRIWAAKPLEELKNWLKVSALVQVLTFLPQAFRDAHFDFYSRTLRGIQQEPPRWKTAVRAVNIGMGDALGKLYVARHFPPEAKTQILDLIHNLIATYRERLQESWLSPATKQAAIHKLESINISKVGYPEKWTSYDSVTISHDYFANYLNACKFQWQQDLDRFPHPVDRTQWDREMPPPTVNAYYNPSFNEIVFPAGILQAPFFDPHADPAVNYGAIGAVIGHEISHAFDDTGAQFDAQGNMRNWWTKEDLRRFQALTKRLSAQYNSFVPKGLPAQDHINGPVSVGENAADLNGLTTAARAYRRVINRGDIKGAVSKHNLQALFCSWSRIYREKWRLEALATYLPTAEHSPGEARAKQTVKNIDDFIEAFNVHAGDQEYLPPNQRIHIW